MRKLSGDDREMEIKLSCHDDKSLPSLPSSFLLSRGDNAPLLPSRVVIGLFILVPRSESQAARNAYRSEIIIIG